MTATRSSLPPSTAVSPAPKTGSPFLAFGLDLVLAVVVVLVITIASIFVWGIYRGIALSKQAYEHGQVLNSSQIAYQIGQPGALAQILMALLGISAAAMLLYFWRRRATRQEILSSRAALTQTSTWGWTLLVTLGVFILTSTVTFVADFLGLKLVPTNRELMQQALEQIPLFSFVFAVLLAPAYEELLFRRVLFGRLLQAGWPRLGMLLSGSVFALAHEFPGISGNGIAGMVQLWLIYGAMGAAFAWLYKRTGTLWAPIAAHAINNMTALAALYWLGV